MSATHFSGPVVSTAGFQDGAGASEVLAAATTLTAADSGKTLLLTLAAGFATTLPAPVAGMKFKFVLALGITGAMTIVTNGGDNIIQGLVIGGGTGAAIVASDEDTITFVQTAESVGDWVEVESDGTNWWVNGQVAADAGLTFTAT